MIAIDDEEGDDDDDGNDTEVVVVTVGAETVTPAYDDCRAVVSWLKVLALCRNVVKVSTPVKAFDTIV